MSLHNLNTPNKQWLMYLNTLSSISGDNLTIKPDTRRNLLLEVSGNNNIFIKKGDISYNLTNLITSTTDASFSNVDISRNLNPVILTGNLIQVGYDLSWELLGREIDGEASGDKSGLSVSLNDDGNIVAIGAPYNDGNGSSSGHTRVYKYNSYDASWIRLGQDIDGDGSFVYSGWAVSLNSSGNNVAIISDTTTSIYKYNDISWVRMGLPISSSESGNNAVSLNSIGNIVAIGNTATDFYRGYIRVYKFNNISWEPMGQIIIGEATFQEFGFSISLNAAGNIVAAGTRGTGGNGTAYVKIYKYNDVSWVLMGQRLIEEAPIDKFGQSVSLNDEGNIIAIGAPNNDGNGTNTGHVRVYKYDTIDLLWKLLGQDIDGLASQLGFGYSVSLNSIGDVVAIGASVKPPGYTKVYYYNNLSWVSIGQTISGEVTGDTENLGTENYSGHSVSLNSTGNILAIGAPLNDGNGYINDGYGGNSFDIGHVRIYNLTGKINSNNSSLGLPSKVWGNAYIRDISVTNISISGNMTISEISNVIQIIPRLANDISSSLGSATNIWQRAFIRDLSNISRINGTNWPITGPIGPTGPTGPTGSTGPTGALGVSLNATLTDISNFRITTTHRVYQNICGDISWSAVNGYYGLAKDAYPSLNPSSSGDLAVSSWIPILTQPIWTTGTGLSQLRWSTVCWSPYLGLFASLASGTDGSTIYRSMWSLDAQHWNQSQGVDYNDTNWTSICWSQEKYMYVAVGNSGSRRLAYSYNGKKWFQWYNQAIIPLPLNSWSSVCWSPERGLFVAVADDGGTNRVATGGATGGATGIENWTSYVPVSENNRWTSVCWSAELGIFVAVAREGTNRVMTSITGYSWSLIPVSTPSTWSSICWSKELGIFVAVATSGSFNVMTSNNGIDWRAISSGIDSSWNSVCWSGELEVFVAVAGNGINRVMSSSNGINWIARTAAQANNWRSICWSPELGLFVAVSTDGTNRSMRTSLKSRPPTSYNIFNREFIYNETFGFNSINENGIWTFYNIAVTTLNVTGTSTGTSDDRLKHNEIAITNGLDVIDRLTPKFYQKTQDLLDANYNGDLSNHAWTYEAGLIAQEVLQISDLSFVVGGGDYYEEKYNLITQTQDLSANNYELSNNYYEPSANNYEVTNNLIAQAYNLNYNYVFVYGLAAIKELHTKVKAQETSILDEELNDLITRIEALESVTQDVSNNIL
jgi:hypothetical protein